MHHPHKMSSIRDKLVKFGLNVQLGNMLLYGCELNSVMLACTAWLTSLNALCSLLLVIKLFNDRLNDLQLNCE